MRNARSRTKDLLRHHDHRGSALVIVLCFVVLIAGLVVFFLSKATSERVVSSSSAGGTKVELLTDTAFGVIVDDLRQEAIGRSDLNGSGDHILYVPKTPASAAPLRAESGIGFSTLPNLLRLSDRLVPSSRASASSTSDPSFNGRYVNLALWNSHYLLPLKNAASLYDSTPAADFVAPDWVVLTRDGPAVGVDVSKLKDASAGNKNYAIGRYAYAVYDEGGLLDINTAGFPSTMTANQYGPKGGTFFADLTQLSIPSDRIDQIVGYRNYASAKPNGDFGTFSWDANGISRFTTRILDPKRNFIEVEPDVVNGRSDQALISRQQLIRMMQDLGYDEPTKIALQNSLQYLGTFSREVNSPTWAPTVNLSAPYAYKDSRFDSSSSVINPFIPSARVISSFTRANGTLAIPGEPLVKDRFSLNKLALLEKMKGPGTLSANEIEQIARYFGLDPVNDSNGYFRHWSYPTSNPKFQHNPNGIMSLNEVAAVNREPEFFEIIQAGILAGSVGKAGGRGDVLNSSWGYNTSTFDDPDGKATLQLLRIGANIIDQWDTDNFPTTISLPATGDSVYGIEDLPYINKLLFTASGPRAVVPPFDQVFNYSIAFQLWNPHQAISSNTGAYPSAIRLAPLTAALSPNEVSDFYQLGIVREGVVSGQSRSYTWYWNAKSQQWSTGTHPDFFDELPQGGILNVPFSAPTTAFREPAASPAIELKSMIGAPPDSAVKEDGSIFSQLTGNTWLFFMTSTVYRIQCLDENGTYRTYGTFVGLDNSNSPAPGTAYKQAPWLSLSNANSAKWYAAPKSDPRTFRFGSGQSDEYSLVNATSSIAPAPGQINSKITMLAPFLGSQVSSPYRIDLWAVNSAAGNTSNPANPSYPDKDGQIRPGDSFSFSSSPLYKTGGALRPIILNRPFRSVGELGYAYRDMPWKTLDLASAKSPDAALLDMFTLRDDQSVLAGSINPNTRQPEVLASLITGAIQKQATGTTVTAAKALDAAKAIIANTKNTPLISRADLVTQLMNDSSITSISSIKTEREAVVRSLADAMNTRTWNLMIDLVVQVGRYPKSAASLQQFIVEGEMHCWIHLAIDRYTMKIVDKQVEVVRE